jgi:hypothetical protein
MYDAPPRTVKKSKKVNLRFKPELADCLICGISHPINDASNDALRPLHNKVKTHFVRNFSAPKNRGS